ncbi:uncharacterized protein LOC117113037 [Anneissia japonica]|uniref:uncharacterized protein LOC117113037 n=1 Tax=Anneissia japonica TaxID=1529436 RepID=UPI0014254CEE|nr:uncharacterized protein LOC117113037 [Anneissia japonica]
MRTLSVDVDKDRAGRVCVVRSYKRGGYFVEVPPRLSIAGETPDDWVADVRAQLELRLLTPKAAAAFVKENLAGYARKEINGRGKEVGEDAEKILAVLLRVFGDGNTLPQLQQRFFSYKQMPQQDLLSCSLELVSLYDNIVSLDGAYSACRESSLKSRLAEAVVDENLKSCSKYQVIIFKYVIVR